MVRCAERFARRKRSRGSMLLYLESVSDLRPEDLLARTGKQGRPAVRGPVATASAAGTPLDSLAEGDKLHIVGMGTEDSISGYAPEELLALLARLGLSRTVRLKQIHLIAGRTGAGEQQSYAARFAGAFANHGFQVDEFKAPLGDVRADERGKVWVRLPGEDAWQPSSSALNYYTGPRVQDKHRK
jgi:hypothetical protein